MLRLELIHDSKRGPMCIVWVILENGPRVTNLRFLRFEITNFGNLLGNW